MKPRSPSHSVPDMSSLKEGYLHQLNTVFPEIIRLMRSLTQAEPDTGNAAPLAKLVHSLSGLGTTVGFPAISESGRALEVSLNPLTNTPVTQIHLKRDIVLNQLETFEQACRQALLSEPLTNGKRMEEMNMQGQSVQKTVCILSKPGMPLHDLDKQLRHFGYTVHCTDDTAAFRDSIFTAQPHVMIVYTDFSEQEAFLLRSLPRASSGMDIPQMIVISPRDDFEARLAAVRLGVQGYFTQNADVIQIIDKIEQLVAKASAQQSFHVLIVDDDEIQVKFYTHVLESAGIVTTVVSEPQEALQVIADQAVDLVLMDFIMPHCNGQELATIIRQHEKYVSLPIIFLSARDDIEALLINTGLGIDDFLVKPVMSEQLVSVVRSRAERSAELQVLMARDSFTGLLNHVHFMDMLAMELGQVKRYKTNTAYVIIDIDRFKNINDTYGHIAGDHVIKNLARMLQQRLRRSDIIGRCGGEEFGIIMPDCTQENACIIIESMRQQFGEMAFKVDQHDITVTFSAGLAMLNGYNNVDDLIKAADKALYAAKNQGRNRLIVV